MDDREGVLRALAAQEALRGTVPDEVIDTAIAALQALLAERPASDRAVELRRRQATVLFADVAGFTAFAEDLDPEVVAGLMNEMWELWWSSCWRKDPLEGRDSLLVPPRRDW
jgi:class 3 adenylate cyclase